MKKRGARPRGLPGDTPVNLRRGPAGVGLDDDISRCNWGVAMSASGRGPELRDLFFPLDRAGKPGQCHLQNQHSKLKTRSSSTAQGTVCNAL